MSDTKGASTVGRGLYPCLERTVKGLKQIFGDSADLNIAGLKVSGVSCAVASLEGMTSSKDLAVMLFSPLMEYSRALADSNDVYRFIAGEGIFSAEKKSVSSLLEAARLLCSGYAVIFVDGVQGAVAISAQGFDKRAVSEPDSEANIKGSHEALSDSLRTSLALIRRRARTPSLRFLMTKAGKVSGTDVCIAYISERVPMGVVKRVKESIEKIRLPFILTSGSVIPFILDKNGPAPFFSGASTTQRPDVLLAKLNEGRVAVLVDGTPYAVIAPTLFVENFQTVDDYEDKPYFAFYKRWLRYIAFFIASFLPGIYVATAGFHPEVLSRSLLLSLIASEEITPYPLAAELAIIIVMFELLKEAGLRLPRAIGGAVSVVGGLIIGDAAVSSGLISAPILIIIGVTATSSFVVPSLDPQTTVLRLLGVIAGGTLGFFGMAVLMTVILVNAGALSGRIGGLSVPYLSPISPLTVRGLRDVVTRIGFRRMEKSTVRVEDMNGSTDESKDDGKGS